MLVTLLFCIEVGVGIVNVALLAPVGIHTNLTPSLQQ
jgi:hypothetical protein